MAKLPRVKEITRTNALEEVMVFKMIPLTANAEDNITEETDNLRFKLRDKNKDRADEYRERLLRENNSLETLQEQYVESKVRLNLSEQGKEATDELMKEEKKIFGKVYLKGKDESKIVEELVNIVVDTMNKKEIIDILVKATLFNICRETENLRNKVFKNINEVGELLSKEMQYDIFKEYSTENTPTEEEIKN